MDFSHFLRHFFHDFLKMHVSNADAQIHEFRHHLKIHFLMEPIAIGVHNFFSGHVLGRLLEPHVKGTIFINFLARSVLINKNGSLVNAIFSVGRDGALKMVSDNSWKAFNFQEGAFPRMMAERGFPQEESDGVVDYFYRRDGFKLWDILFKYVTGIVNKEFKDDLDVEKDEALKRFSQSMSDENEGNIPGFPKIIKTKELLIETLTNIIFTGSVQHTALNAPHYLYSYVPFHPAYLTKWMPKEGIKLTWEWIKKALPTMEQTEKAHLLFMFLSKKPLCTLIDLNVFKDEYPHIQKNLNEELKQLSSEIRKRKSEYNYLDPASIACSVET